MRHDPEIRPRYLEQLCLMTNGVLEEGRVLAELAHVDALIRPAIAAEVPVLWAPRGLDPLDAATEGTYAAEFERMKSWIPARIAAVRSLVAAEGVACAKGCEEGRVLPCDYSGLPSERACRGGSWEACRLVAPTGAGGAGGGTPPAGTGGAAGAAEDGGCGCRVGATAPSWRGVALLALLGVLIRRRLRAGATARSASRAARA